VARPFRKDSVLVFDNGQPVRIRTKDLSKVFHRGLYNSADPLSKKSNN
jgi:hypothetical protein